MSELEEPREDIEAPPAQSLADAQVVGAGRLTDIAQDIGAAGSGSALATVGRGQPTGNVSGLLAFDGHHPPRQDLIDDCVHCGFCLPTCPTYVLFGEEMDSPRGRIYLMREGLEGEPMTDTMVRHFDLCLGCLACVTACPSGVQYEKLIEATRPQIERHYGRSTSDRLFRRLIYSLFPYPARLMRLSPLLRFYQRTHTHDLLTRTGLLRLLPERIQAMENLMPEVPSQREEVAYVTAARSPHRARVGMLLGCVQRAFYPQVNAATVRVLAAEGCTVVAPPGQGCCGALSLHAGREEEGLDCARRLIDTFERESVEYLAVNVAGCGSAMKEYGYLLRDDPQYAERAARFSSLVRDVSELIQEMSPVAERHPLPIRVVYHDACHLSNGQGITRQPRETLRQIPELQVREVSRERTICCGSAGTWNLLEPEPARALADRKASAVADAAADLLVTSNPGCLLQINAGLRRQGLSLPSAHVMEVVDASLRHRSIDSLLSTVHGSGT